MEPSRKVALITGSAKGLGRMTALQLAERGFDIVVNYVHSEAEADTLCQRIRQLGANCHAVQADVSKTADRERLVREAEARFGRVDVLVNNAGPFIRERRFFREYEAAEIEGLMQGNLIGVMHLDHLVIPGMRENGWGRIIHFGFGHASEARGWPHRAVYAAAKVGLVSFTKTLAVEEAGGGITVNMICPGDIRGANKERLIEEAEHLHDDESPRGRPGTGEDISRVIAFLCESRSDFLTGNIIDVSGGLDPIRAMVSGGTVRDGTSAGSAAGT
ncbi:3-oxoacyl-[acyl-carrier protein] reductase [Paenibacillus sp. UNCCL117]|uniref:SDR family oxidoreductase n=1 Tax=unclassified Paenibacillus TaxID=185978 RepID=UPI000884616B|nr:MULTISPECIES: SDR family oxidoreductase [unclassified Paenibacillus]SDE03596.1 3-oxoacyl-[acyl-carrier protein] reductase [Paenibacillus sp. cl123]SFW57447.1 3-oxoacyl-[acyl-carrier protein] reductase [Paenibacillus sp. UNCCL117]